MVATQAINSTQGVNRIGGYFQQQAPAPQASDASGKQLRGLIQANRIMAAQIQEMQNVMIQQAMATQAMMQQTAQQQQPKSTLGKIFSGIKNAIAPLALAGVAVLGVLGIAYKGNGQTLVQLGKDLFNCVKQRTVGAMPLTYEIGLHTLTGTKSWIAKGLNYAAMGLAGVAGLNFIQGYVNPNKH
jgi:hypothetical protein